MYNPEQLEYVEDVIMGLDELHTELKEKFTQEWNPEDPDLTTSLILVCVRESLSHMRLSVEHHKLKDA